MSIDQRTVWEYAQLVQLREPAPEGAWPIKATLYRGEDEGVEMTNADNAMLILDALGRDQWELLGAPEVFSVVATHTDSGGGQRDRAYWVERRFWLKRPRAV